MRPRRTIRDPTGWVFRTRGFLAGVLTTASPTRRAESRGLGRGSPRTLRTAATAPSCRGSPATYGVRRGVCEWDRAVRTKTRRKTVTVQVGPQIAETDHADSRVGDQAGETDWTGSRFVLPWEEEPSRLLFFFPGGTEGVGGRRFRGCTRAGGQRRHARHSRCRREAWSRRPRPVATAATAASAAVVAAAATPRATTPRRPATRPEADPAGAVATRAATGPTGRGTDDWPRRRESRRRRRRRRRSARRRRRNGRRNERATALALATTTTTKGGPPDGC